MNKQNKLQFIFGDVTLTFTPADIDAILDEWEAEHPGKKMSSEEFANRCMQRLQANTQPTRTILHN